MHCNATVKIFCLYRQLHREATPCLHICKTNFTWLMVCISEGLNNEKHSVSLKKFREKLFEEGFS